MTNRSCFLSKILLVLGAILLVLPSDSAFAGELIPRVARLRGSSNNLRVRRVLRSTNATKRINRLKPDTRGLSYRQMSPYDARIDTYEREMAKYEVKLAKWETRVAKTVTRQEQKKERESLRREKLFAKIREKERKAEAKRARRDERSRTRRKEGGILSSKSSSETENVVVNEDKKKAESFYGKKADESGSQSATTQKTDDRPGFWTRLKRALFGK